MSTLIELLQAAAIPLTGSAQDYDALMRRVGDARLVLLGEASHGTHEFYRERAQITKRLIQEKGFTTIAVEADWPDACRINRFVRGSRGDADAVDALEDFERFPQWMWRNADVLDFVGWLREHNDAQPTEDSKTGFYGLDLYSLHASIDAVISYLMKEDVAAAERARVHYACFDRFDRDVQTYGLASAMGVTASCEAAVIQALTELRVKKSEYLRGEGRGAVDEFFCAEQNSIVIKNAEQYYRTMFRGEVSSWNLRDRHMMDTLLSLIRYLEQYQHPAKVVVWAHNSHLGNASATEMGERGEFNLGQLVRQRFGPEAVAIGFTTHSGTVTAASDWDAPAERKYVRPAVSDSYEDLFHHVGHARFWLDLALHPGLAMELRNARLERAIGVIYRPETELVSHYFRARLPDQFDGVLHFDKTRAVEPLERTVRKGIEVEETFPSGL